jgi:hypothetical protein
LFYLDETALPLATRAFSQLAIDYLSGSSSGSAQLEQRAVQDRVAAGAHVFERGHDGDVRHHADRLDARAARAQEIRHGDLRITTVRQREMAGDQRGAGRRPA